MKLSRLRLTATAVAVAALTTFAPGVAHADAPANDDFDGATEITALPATTTVDTTGATKAADDPIICGYQSHHTVWLRYTATATELVRLTNQDNSYSFFAVFTGTRGALTPVPGACTSPWESTKTFSVTAGTTYHLAVAEHYSGYTSPVTLTTTPVRAAANDDRAAATPVTLPSRIEGDLTRATAEPGEVPPSCDTTATKSLWYRYQGTRTQWVNVSAYYNAISVHRASDLSEVDCFASGGNLNGAVFATTAGETYLIRVARSPERVEPFWMDVVAASPLKPTALVNRHQPTVLDDLPFEILSGDRHGRVLTSGVIDFGDGTSRSFVAYDQIRHQYARDGVYTITVTGSTSDGRTGTGTSTVTIDTHDVSVAALSVPSSVRAGQTKPITVSVANTRQTENVRVTLYRVSETGGYDEAVGVAVQRVVASPTGKVGFPFAYTYTTEDATLGKVTFRAVAALEAWDVREAKPDDNEARATTTSVRPAAASNARTD
ncbi:hypothetical protein BBK82_04690 [Lentzea guizhouensis]|uniref:PKD domain-containing protein n=1 Tax=Lentzea guizhouensis TaxID=1586287 RepID=A0A1B2HCP1_9PSEU|nr:PKD domain-containing protein [Lentzea guizhouensis]ANZ35483.1 hypothetical protein BBK82_04690 [Lentzea guizhouensis]